MGWPEITGRRIKQRAWESSGITWIMVRSIQPEAIELMAQAADKLACSPQERATLIL
jgi:hypothetical protein